MTRYKDLLLTALAPAIWGTSYAVSTIFLPEHSPFAVAMMRALPAGLLLLAIVRQLPPRGWLWRIALLGALNFSVFWSLLFVAAYRLPGGVAATVGAVQPIFVVFLASLILATPVRAVSLIAALAGVGGVALLLLTPLAALDPVGIAAGLGGAASMAAGVVLSRKWQPPVPPLTFAAWQLTAGGVLLVPVALILTPDWPVMTFRNVAGLIWLGGLGAAVTYLLWFRGLSRIDPSQVSLLGLLSPLTAVLVGWAIMHETLSPMQIVGAVIVLGSVWLGQTNPRIGRNRTPRPA